MRVSRAWLLCSMALSACGWDSTTADGLTWLTTSRSVGSNGQIRLNVDVPPDATSLQLVAELELESRGYVASLTQPDGDVPFVASETWDGVHNRTNAGFSSYLLVMDWPIAARDGPLPEGRLRFDLRADQRGTHVPITVAFKHDDDLDSGTLNVDLIYAGGLIDNPDVVSATETAVAHWGAIYEAFGLTIHVVARSWEGSGTLSSPGYGSSAEYLDALAQKPPRTVSVIVVNEVQGVSGVYGVSGGIPGPLIATDRSVVTVSALEHAGRDNEFNPTEIQLFGETMAHEVGHYLGLFHPVELPIAGKIGSWDALGDTPECQTVVSCNNGELGTNLMYPTPLCEVAPCEPQNHLTTEQIGVMQRYVGVD